MSSATTTIARGAILQGRIGRHNPPLRPAITLQMPASLMLQPYRLEHHLPLIQDSLKGIANA